MSSPSASPPVPDLSADSFSEADDSKLERKTPQRRQTAFYPNMNASNKPLKPFSRSAAKRGSVMALGSIEHLQHYFTKTGIAAKENPFKRNTGGVPAIGGLARLNRPNPSLGSILEFDLPPSPSAPAIRPPIPHVEKTYETDPENLKPGVIQDLHEVSKTWGVGRSDPISLTVQRGDRHTDGDLDVLAILQITTRAIRSVRNYLLSLPDDTPPSQSARHLFRPGSLSSPAKKPSAPVRSPSEPLTRIRHSALEVLTVLRMLEESARLPLTDDAYDAQSDQGSSSSPPPRNLQIPPLSRSASPSVLVTDDSIDPDASFAFSVVSVPGREDGVPVWIEEEESSDEEAGEKREVWDERLMLGSGWLYRKDLQLNDLRTEKEAVTRYLDVVDEVLFGGPKDDIRGWERAAMERRKVELDRQGRSKRRVSTGDVERGGSSSPGSGVSSRHPSVENRRVVSAADMLSALQNFSVAEEDEAELDAANDSMDDEELPSWAKRSSYVDDPLGRAYALLVSFLPSDDLALLPSPMPERTGLLEVLSSGQLLCIAYNAGIRRSRKPWGYINKDAVHDIAALEVQYTAAVANSTSDKDQEKRRTGWTFRRTDNLRLWAAALKLRYMLPLVTSGANVAMGDGASNGTPTGTPTKLKFASDMGPPIYFDARIVARKEEGWETMLETAMLKWVEAVIEETRSAR